VTYGRVFNLAQEETPTLAELVTKLATLVGSRSEIVPVAEDALVAAELDRAEISPFSTRWMSFLDPSRARDELGFRHLPLEVYLGRIAASFLAHPPSPPEALAHRAREIALAAAIQG
jgi:nucleoside-diphosphate-sugar epimerase